jgi:hypothetical protein
MRIWQKSAAALVTLCVFAAPLRADVVPARKAKADRDAATVEVRLVTLGVEAPAAKASAERLTPSELRFFASDAQRIQPVGQQDMFAGQTVNMWYESLGGAALLAAGFGLAYYMIHNNE